MKSIRFIPKIICVEFNPYLTEFGSVVVKYKKNNFDNSNYYYGASLNAYIKLLKKRGYKLVAIDSNNINAFFINPKKFINKFKELDISNNKNLNKFLKNSKEIIRNIDVNRYINYLYELKIVLKTFCGVIFFIWSLDFIKLSPIFFIVLSVGST